MNVLLSKGHYSFDNLDSHPLRFIMETAFEKVPVFLSLEKYYCFVQDVDHG